MTDYYSNSRDYHDDLDRFEARVRAEQAERDAENEKPQCLCLLIVGDNDQCPMHGGAFDEGSDNTMSGQLEAAGFGQGGVM